MGAQMATFTPPFKPPIPPKEMVHHPDHYNKGEFEVIDVIYDWNLNFALGSAIKYIASAEHKGNDIEDLKKAKQYIEFEIENRLSK